MKVFKGTLKNGVIVMETFYYLMNVNLLAFLCGYNVIKRKHELSKIQRKRIYFINRLEYAELKIFCICVGVYRSYEGNGYNKIYEILSTLKNKNLKMNKILIEK